MTPRYPSQGGVAIHINNRISKGRVDDDDMASKGLPRLGASPQMGWKVKSHTTNHKPIPSTNPNKSPKPCAILQVGSHMWKIKDHSSIQWSKVDEQYPTTPCINQ